MTWSEAVVELALDPTAPPPTADELRRRYLRGVRQRRPEVDPHGFQRLREAYEYLLARLSAEMPAEVPAAPSIGEPMPAPPVVVEPVPTPPVPAAPTHAVPAPVEQSRERPAPTEPPPMRFARLRHALTAAALPGSPAPPVAEVLEEILGSLHDGLTETAAQLADELRRCLAQRGDESILLRGTLATRWLLVGELLAAASDLPRDAVISIAMGIEAGDLDLEHVWKKRFDLYLSIHAGHAGHARTRRAIAKVLARQAPTLAVALNPFLEPTKEAGEGIPWRFVLALLLIILLLTAGGYVSRRLSGSFQTDQAQPSAQSQIAAGQLRAAQGLGRQQDGAVAKLARQLSRQAATEGLSALSQTAYQLANQAETHRCDTVRVLRDNLLHEVQQLDPPRQARYLEEYTVLDGRIKEACNKLRLRADEYDTWDQQ